MNSMPNLALALIIGSVVLIAIERAGALLRYFNRPRNRKKS